jgi:hypothetical protein
MTLVMAVSFRGGALLAAGVDPRLPEAGTLVTRFGADSGGRPLRRVVKTPWGIVAGTAPADIVAALRGLLHRSSAPSPDDLLPFSREDSAGAGVHARWLFTYESPEPGDSGAWAGAESPAPAPSSGRMGAPISVYRSSAHGPVRLSWGAVLLPEALAPDLGREGTLRLHAVVADDDEQHARFSAVMGAFAWFAERVPGLLNEVDVGFHEPGHLYSVDRFAVE